MSDCIGTGCKADSLLARIAALEAERDALKQDAERFRSLQFRGHHAVDQWDGVMWRCAPIHDPNDIGLISAIDAARSKP